MTLWEVLVQEALAARNALSRADEAAETGSAGEAACAAQRVDAETATEKLSEMNTALEASLDVQAGPPRRPSYRQTIYVRVRTGSAAAEVARRKIYPAPPRSVQWRSRLAGPRELECVPTPF